MENELQWVSQNLCNCKYSPVIMGTTFTNCCNMVNAVMLLTNFSNMGRPTLSMCNRMYFPSAQLPAYQ